MYADRDAVATIPGDLLSVNPMIRRPGMGTMPKQQAKPKDTGAAKREPPVAKKSPHNLGQQHHPARPFKRRPWLLGLSATLVLAWIVILGYLAFFT
jgi:hypothetical protein